MDFSSTGPDSKWIAAQQRVVKVLLQQPRLFLRYAEQLREDYFTEPNLKLLIRTMHTLHGTFGIFDLYLLRNSLHYELDETTLATLHQWSAAVVESDDITYDISLLKDYAARRLVHDLGKLLQQKSFNDEIEVSELKDYIHTYTRMLDEMQPASQTESLKQILDRIQIENSVANNCTWFDTQLQDYLGNLDPGELVVIGSRPGVGKTAFIHTQLVHLACACKIPVGYINLVENDHNLVLKLLKVSEGCRDELKHDTLPDHEQPWPIYISNNLAGSRFRDIKAAANYLKYKYDIQVLAIDCFQQITYQPKMNYRDYELGQVLKEIKRMAKEMNMAVILTSQLSRMTEKRGYLGMPVLSDLKETSYLEEVADKVLLLHRYDYYGITVYEDGTPTGNDSNVLIAKNKYGKSGKVLLSFDSKLGKFLPKAQPLPMVFEFPANRLTDLE